MNKLPYGMRIQSDRDVGKLSRQLHSVMARMINSFKDYLARQRAEKEPERIEPIAAEKYAELCWAGAMNHYHRKPSRSFPYLTQSVHSSRADK